VVDLMAVRESSCYNDGKKPMKRVRAAKHYSRCGEKRHNSCICIVEIKDIDNSDTFEK